MNFSLGINEWPLEPKNNLENISTVAKKDIKIAKT